LFQPGNLYFLLQWREHRVAGDEFGLTEVGKGSATPRACNDGVVSPFPGLHRFGGGSPRAARADSLALGYRLSGFQPFQFEPRYLGGYGI